LQHGKPEINHNSLPGTQFIPIISIAYHINSPLRGLSVKLYYTDLVEENMATTSMSPGAMKDALRGPFLEQRTLQGDGVPVGQATKRGGNLRNEQRAAATIPSHPGICMSPKPN
jgi:hypothetical protein